MWRKITLKELKAKLVNQPHTVSDKELQSFLDNLNKYMDMFDNGKDRQKFLDDSLKKAEDMIIARES